jgi:hypothetical protein
VEKNEKLNSIKKTDEEKTVENLIICFEGCLTGMRIFSIFE